MKRGVGGDRGIDVAAFLHRGERAAQFGQIRIGAAARGKVGHLGLEPHPHFEQLEHIVDFADFLGSDLEGTILRAIGDIGTRPAPRHQQPARAASRE